MRVADLEGPSLDYWVGRASRLYLVRFDPTGTTYIDKVASPSERLPYSPSTNWTSGGPIIEQHRIGLNMHGAAWGAWIVSSRHQITEPDQRGPSPLIAAMRAYVASKFGDEIPDAEPGSIG